uniref:hypothetical protein n=1 Tax=Pseudomonas laurentiana TaxID=2364649 RepID=UPI0029C87966|nr:hypothetical protein [Pseudomonas laurentiana]
MSVRDLKDRQQLQERLEGGVSVYALIDPSQAGEGEDTVLDGVEVHSFDAAPQSLGLALESEWEPESWLLRLSPSAMATWPGDRQPGLNWFKVDFRLSTSPDAQASLYAFRAVDDAPTPLDILNVQVLGNGKTLRKLMRFSQLRGLPVSPKASITELFQQATDECDWPMLVVHDVGQANWNSLFPCSVCPRWGSRAVLFYDCGVPTGYNYATLPSPPLDPFANALAKAPVILSHWDMDHWAGAAAGQPLFGGRGIRIAWDARALDRPWIVPNQGRAQSGQRVSSMGWRLALALARRGNLYLWPSQLNGVVSRQGHRIIKCQPLGGGNDNNNTGLALLINAGASSREPQYLLTVGDADYSSLYLHYPQAQVCGYRGLVASHHGGNINSVPPAPLDHRSKLVYSHGARYHHPTHAARLAHSAAGWQQVHETHQRRSRRIHGGVQQQVGSVSLGYHWQPCICAHLHLPADANCPIQ